VADGLNTITEDALEKSLGDVAPTRIEEKNWQEKNQWQAAPNN
jgi:hypothetical protein